MLRKTVVQLALIPIAGCFSPEATEDTGTGTAGETDAPTTGDSGTSTAGPAATTDGPASTSGGTDQDTTATPTGESGQDTSGSDSETGETGDVPVTCGNGRPDDGEECDDGNDVNGDGCNVDCVESGSVVWQSLFEGGDMEATALAVNEDGEVMVLGNSRASDDVFYADWRRLFASDGEVVATGPTGGFDASRIAASGDDWVIAHLVQASMFPGEQDPLGREAYGSFGIARVDNLFVSEWSTELANTREVGAIAALEGGGILLSGSVLNSGNFFVYEHDGFIAGYNNGGSLAWERLDPYQGGPRDCHPAAAFPNGSAAVACVTSTRQVTFRRYHANGTLAAQTPLGVVSEALEWINYFSFDRTYPTIAAGFDNQAALVVENRVFKIAQNAAVEWDQAFQETGDEQFFSAAFDGAGALVLGGRRLSASGSNGLDGVILKVAADGTLLWTHLVESANDDEVRAVAITPTDRVAFGATLGRDTSSPQILVTMLTP